MYSGILLEERYTNKTQANCVGVSTVSDLEFSIKSVNNNEVRNPGGGTRYNLTLRLKGVLLLGFRISPVPARLSDSWDDV